MVGDERAIDIAPAKNIGCSTAQSFQFRQDDAAGIEPTYVIHSLQQLLLIVALNETNSVTMRENVSGNNR